LKTLLNLKIKMHPDKLTKAIWHDQTRKKRRENPSLLDITYRCQAHLQKYRTR
jgi:hypothetical protein